MLQPFIIVISLIIFQILAFFYIKRLINSRIEAIKDQIRQELTDFITPPDDKTPSQLEILIQNISPILASKLLETFKMSQLGQLSVDSKLSKKLAEAVSQDQLNNMNPIIGAIASRFPTLAKLVMNNPQLANQLAGLMGGAGGSGAGGSGGSGNHNGSGELVNFNKFGV